MYLTAGIWPSSNRIRNHFSHYPSFHYSFYAFWDGFSFFATSPPRFQLPFTFHFFYSLSYDLHRGSGVDKKYELLSFSQWFTCVETLVTSTTGLSRCWIYYANRNQKKVHTLESFDSKNSSFLLLWLARMKIRERKITFHGRKNFVRYRKLIWLFMQSFLRIFLLKVNIFLDHLLLLFVTTLIS